MIHFPDLIETQRSFFQSGQTRDLTFRLNALKTLRNSIQIYEREIMKALKEDLNKSEFDAYSTEIGVVLEDLRFTIRRLSAWAKPKKVKTPLTHIGSKSYIYSEPYGVTLIIAPWNYPFQLAISPLIGAIAAGNCIILKPSERTPKTSELMEQILTDIFSEDYVTVVQGGPEESTALLKEKVDYIFFTGSVPVGKIVMKAASAHLTPVTLELGGKSPCIVHKDAHLKQAAKRVAWGKFMNAGQTCIAPDYLYVHKSIQEPFLEYLKNAIHDLYGMEPIKNSDFTRIVNTKHFDRLARLLESGERFSGGQTDPDTLMIEPTILTDVSWEDPIMNEEIFGPLLPVFVYHDLTDVFQAIEKAPNPLSLYLFSEDSSVQNEILDRVSFGGGCVNDTVYHFASPYLPFGGVGTSGVGAYHGKASFDTFSHKKSVLKQTTRFDLPYRYPNAKNGLKNIKRFLK